MKFFKWILKNKRWIFSGIGVFIIALLLKIIWPDSLKFSKEIKNKNIEAHDSSNININNYQVNTLVQEIKNEDTLTNKKTIINNHILINEYEAVSDLLYKLNQNLAFINLKEYQNGKPGSFSMSVYSFPSEKINESLIGKKLVFAKGDFMNSIFYRNDILDKNIPQSIKNSWKLPNIVYVTQRENQILNDSMLIVYNDNIDTDTLVISDNYVPNVFIPQVYIPIAVEINNKRAKQLDYYEINQHYLRLKVICENWLKNNVSKN